MRLMMTCAATAALMTACHHPPHDNHGWGDQPVAVVSPKPPEPSNCVADVRTTFSGATIVKTISGPGTLHVPRNHHPETPPPICVINSRCELQAVDERASESSDYVPVRAGASASAGRISCEVLRVR